MIEIKKIIKKGGIGVMPTDTIYGLVGSALNKKTVERIYKVRKRNLKKPLIILISSLNDLKKFGVDLTGKSYPQVDTLNLIWPGKITLILSLPRASLRSLEYLHRGTGKLAFRLPDDKKLINILKKTGPLVAPSANIEGEKIAVNIKEVREYFGNKIDFYLGGKKMSGKPSSILGWKNGGLVLIREGSVSAYRLKKKKLIR